MHAPRPLRAARRAPGPLALGAAAVALLAVAAPRAAAQPACAAGDLASYLASGFACQLSGWRFSGFDLFAIDDGTGSAGAIAPESDGTTTFLTPFTDVDASGRRTFGFELAGFAAVATADPGDVGPGDAFALATLTFEATSLDPAGVVSRAGIVGAVEGSTLTPGRTNLYSVIAGAIGDATAPFPCVDVLVENFGNGSKPRAIEAACPAPRPGAILFQLLVTAAAERFDSPRTTLGVATASIDRVSVTVPGQVVPEPATVALLTGGLVVLAGVSGRRRGGTIG